MATSTDDASCELCSAPGGEIIWADTLCRVVRIADPDYTGFCRVIWSRHVREMTDLAAAERRHFMSIVFAVEAALRSLYRPDKINLASFGNLTPHLHWHVIPRFIDDRHFPNPVWGPVRREATPARPAIDSAALRQAIVEALAEEQSGTG